MVRSEQLHINHRSHIGNRKSPCSNRARTPHPDHRGCTGQSGWHNVAKSRCSRNCNGSLVETPGEMVYTLSDPTSHGGCMPHLVPYRHLEISEQEQLQRARSLYEFCNMRRSIRGFSDRPVNKEVIELLLETANTAPSGGNKQPWQFVVVTDPQLKRGIRLATEAECRRNG